MSAIARGTMVNHGPDYYQGMYTTIVKIGHAFQI